MANYSPPSPEVELDAIWQVTQCSRAECDCHIRRTSTNQHCPAHEDNTPSLSVQKRDGKVVWVCFAGCDQRDVTRAIHERLTQHGLAPSGSRNGRNGHNGHHPPTAREITPDDPHLTDDEDPAPPDAPSKKKRPQIDFNTDPPNEIYEYRTPDGTLIAWKGRKDLPDGSKTFRWCPADSQKWGSLRPLTETDLPLYHAERIAAAPKDEPVYLVEGERAANALMEQGFLAATLAGGASMKDYGTALDVLRGRHVQLWADNDSAGKEYMMRLHIALKPIAASVKWVAVTRQMPVKGDAYDYFHVVGGTAEELRNGGVVAGTRYEYTAMGGVKVYHVTNGELVEFQFDNIDAGRREWNAEMVVRVPNQEPHAQRINILSQSSVTALQSTLKQLYGEKKETSNRGGASDYRDVHDWPRVLSTVFSTLRHAVTHQDHAEDILDVPLTQEEPFFLAPFFPLNQPTIVFGDGSSGKSYFCLAAALHVAAGARQFCGMRIPEGPVLYVDYEDSRENLALRASRLCEGMGLSLRKGRFKRYDPRGLPLAEQIDALRAKVLNEGIVLVIVDSAAPACGSAPEHTEETNRYFDAVIKLCALNVTVVTVAHINKGYAGRKPDTHKPFGNGYWHHRARRTWYVKRVQETDAEEIDVAFYCRKVNDGPKPSTRTYQYRFTPNYGPVSIKSADIGDSPELMEELDPTDRLAAHLAHNGPMTVQDITEALGGTTKQWDSILRRKEGKLFTRVSTQLHPTGKGRPARLWGRIDRSHTEEEPHGKSVRENTDDALVF